MKSRTKWLFCLCLLAWLSTGCDSKSDITITDPPGAMATEWETHYIYKNESSFDIEMEYISSNGDKRVGESVQIKQGDKYEFIQKYNAGRFSPLNQLYPEGSMVRISISNGIVKVICRRSGHPTDDSNIFEEKAYVRTKDKKYLLQITCYTYTFTDDCFKEGTPIGNAEISIETVGENRS